MKAFKKYILFVVLTLASVGAAMATHQRAGEITYRRVGILTYEATIITYTYTPSPANRTELELHWGDGVIDTVPLTKRQDFPNDISRNEYVGTHTYSSAGTYLLSVEDPNRNTGILNIPNSVSIPFYIETLLVINPFVGNNDSPQLLNPPMDQACVNQPFFHNPGAYDPDGDSLVYSLVTCKGYDGEDIPGYTLPAAAKSIGINPQTGDFVWDNPPKQGEYNIAIRIEEYRKGVRIGYVIRDMQIVVAACNNQAPEIIAPDEICVQAGDTVLFNIQVTDPNPADYITLTATGGAFQQANAAVLQQNTIGNPVHATFRWITNCSNVQRNPYYIYIKAKDNGSPIALTAQHTVAIRVLAPPLENLQATAASDGVSLSWNKTTCDNAIGYKVYRRRGCPALTPDSCSMGFPAEAGYKQIAQWKNLNQTTYKDEDTIVLLGADYSYGVVAYFADGAESFAATPLCVTLQHGQPEDRFVDLDSIPADTTATDTTGKTDYEIVTANYTMPNVFTPNSDGQNDVFVSQTDYKNIDHVYMQVFNRWGRRVFHTSDIDIRWDGTDENTKQKSAEGVYYYICEIYVQQPNGSLHSELRKGTVTLMR